MPELLLELFSEEIPARMQARAADDLARLLTEALKPAGLAPEAVRTLYGPRRIALIAVLPAATPAVEEERRGPRADATGPALEGFLRATGLTREELEARDTGKGAYLYAVIRRPGRPTAALLAETLPGLLRRFPWPKSMRWGDGGSFAWVRPLRRILCLFDGEVVRFGLRQMEAGRDDDGHGLVPGDETEGHRVHAPGAFAVRHAEDYLAALAGRYVVPDAGRRIAAIREGVAALAADEELEVVPDEGLLAEVAGLVEWPVPLLGRIDDAFMDLPPEVMRTTMRVNQRYFALRHPDGRAAPRFALVANIVPADGGAAIVAGNERVLRARLSDARFFWDNDRRETLESRLPRLDTVVFHAKLGTQGERVRRLEALAATIAPMVGADPALAARAAKLAKADLASGMVGEFPELQGVMGGYYARADGEEARVAEAVTAHYRPLGPGDAVPAEPVAVAVALADKLDQLVGFFRAGEPPTGSGDPYALRRAALGVIRIIRENGLRLDLFAVADAAYEGVVALAAPASSLAGQGGADAWWKRGVALLAEDRPGVVDDVVGFIKDRLRVQLRAEGARHDIVAAVLDAEERDDDLVRVLARAEAVRRFLGTEDGANLIAAYRRAANILRIEEKRDGRSFAPGGDAGLLRLPEERALATALDAASAAVKEAAAREDFTAAMDAMAALRVPVDAFFDRVIVNDADPALRVNRLRLLSRLRAAMDAVADFSKIEG
ncbi:glycine--tRNA ligase subunit beta [Roseomonas sp. NAR14]|uniref:Glycine--tRNA ligase beta subunit n=1 Tax=Roseomonas acroporae TaxID=2937791 RepID=A0A9X1Y986_9PROT|nr:glycine--tRNA ligase subunit beta [Roseomonas acroporae]MCK8786469.1 glycine--tRNA ligase subunit beta [Roseomonas acroporae]